MMKKKTILTVATVLFCTLALAFSLFSIPAEAAPKKVRLSYVEWSEAVAATNMVKTVIQEKLGMECEIIPMTADKMWASVAAGVTDGMVAAWLPTTHGHFYEEYKDQIVDLGPNLTGTQVGLVVPDVTVGRQTAASGQRNASYITAQSIEDLKKYPDKFHRRIIGIDREAGIMEKTRKAMREYGLYNYELVEGSEISMTAELSNAIRKQKWIVITGWEPHWMFGRWKLRFLDDPKNVYGGEEKIHTIVREGLKEEMPQVYKFLDQFNMASEELEQLMIWIEEDEGMYPGEKALRYMRFHEDQVNAWLK